MKILLVFLSFMFFLGAFISCKSETESETAVFNKKASLTQATTIIKTPIMLGTSVYEHLENNTALSDFKEAMPDVIKEIVMGTAGPYTLFAPSNTAMKVLDSNSLDSVFFKRHIVKGKFTTTHLVKQIRKNGGVYTFISIAGTQLKATRDGMEIVIEDAVGNKMSLLHTDYLAENGVMHLIN